MKRFLLVLLATVTTLLVLASTGGGERNPFHARAAAAQEATPDDAIPVESTASTEPTSTVEPTAIAEPASTVSPTSTAEPMSTVSPTATLTPSATEGAVTPSPEPTATATATGPEQETITIFKVDEHGNPLTDSETGACFEAELTYYSRFSACDRDDGVNDGTITLSVPHGGFYIGETRAPTEYGATTDSVYVDTYSGPVELTFGNVRLEQLTIFVVGENGEPITDDETGACFDVPDYWWDDDYYEPLYSACDSDDGANDGAVVFPGLYPGWEHFIQSWAPKGYARARPQYTQIKVGGPNEFTVTNHRLQPVTVHVVDEQGQPVIVGEHGQPVIAYASPICLRLATWFDDDLNEWETAYRACDDGDGANDGTVVFPGVAPSGYWLVQDWTAKGYSVPEPYWITVSVGSPREITLVNPRIVEAPTATPPATATARPPESPTPTRSTGTGGVVELPDTGTGAKTEPGSTVQLILVGAAVCGLIGTTIRLRRRTHCGS